MPNEADVETSITHYYYLIYKKLSSRFLAIIINICHINRQPFPPFIRDMDVFVEKILSEIYKALSPIRFEWFKFGHIRMLKI